MYVGEDKLHPYPFVIQVDPNSDAKLKGVRSGDEIIRFDNDEVISVRRLFERIGGLRAGREVSLWVRRSGQTIQFRLNVPKNPTAAPDAEQASDKKPDEKASAEGAEGEKKARKKKKPPVVFKPIPADNQ
jgi:C-terminal processing protease CtpA/Prc